MNSKQKKTMYDHYRGLGWTEREINKYGTVDCKGEKPEEKEEKEEKEVKKDKK